MSLIRRWSSIAVATVCCGLAAEHFAWCQADASTSRGPTKDRARTVLSKPLPKLNGDHLRAILLEVRYGPGEASSPHSHPCAVIGYVVEGSVRTQVKGEAEMIYRAGESFYEAPNGVHLVSANASSTEPAKLVAYLICDRDVPLSVDVRENIHLQGSSR
ncbi:MAG: cupin domain-containing protein [Acidobacteriia bacterium]|nr:cupin domain-containing protein [Terriglobia bacterium]